MFKDKGTRQVSTTVKICCIKNEKEAQMAIRAGADAIGLVSEMPSGPGVISLDKIARISAFVSDEVETFLLTSKQSAEDIIAQHRIVQTSTIQIVDDLPVESYYQLRRALPGTALVQVIHVTGESSIEEAQEIAEHVDTILLDSGNPARKIKELGGTGRTHNWELSRQIVKEISIPVYLAGGLNPQNIQCAIRTVQPHGVDVCSGLRSNGRLNSRKIRRFLQQIEAADRLS